MSLIVKGLKMPRNCAWCPFRISWCRERIYMETRPNRCPLIELQPHGDLIDRDALKLDFLNRGIEGIQTDDFSELQQTIDDAPTVIPADDKDGET